jgi:hypothetical protein
MCQKQVEPSEEIRLQLVRFLHDFVRVNSQPKFASGLYPYFHDMIHIVEGITHDPFPVRFHKKYARLH